MTRLEMVADHMRRQEWTRNYGTCEPPRWASAPDRDVWLQRARDAVAGLNHVGVGRDIAARALREFADTRGVNVGDDDGEWWSGYRQAQREALHDAVKYATEIERSNA